MVNSKFKYYFTLCKKFWFLHLFSFYHHKEMQNYKHHSGTREGLTFPKLNNSK